MQTADFLACVALSFLFWCQVPGRAVGGATGSFRVRYDCAPWADSGLDGVWWLVGTCALVDKVVEGWARVLNPITVCCPNYTYPVYIR